MGSRCTGRRSILLVVVAMLSACAQPPRAMPTPAQERTAWSGRLALRIDSDPPQSFFAGFDLRGDARNGELSLQTPLGSTLGRLEWSPGNALLRWNGELRQFESIEALTREATGTELPIRSLFRWLAGEPTAGDGWSADLHALSDGKIVARRTTPAPAVEMRLVFE